MNYITDRHKAILNPIIENFRNIFQCGYIMFEDSQKHAYMLESMTCDILSKIIDASFDDAKTESTPDARFRSFVYESYSMWAYISKNINDLRIRLVGIGEGANKYLRLEPLSIIIVLLKSDIREHLIPHIASLIIDEWDSDFHLFIPDEDSFSSPPDDLRPNGNVSFQHENTQPEIKQLNCHVDKDLLELIHSLAEIGTYRPAKDYEDGATDTLRLHDKITAILGKICNSELE